MKLVTAVVVLAAALALQAGLGAIWPAAYRWVDIMMVPVVCYAVLGSQRSAMLVGCTAGLTQDAWFQTGTLGLGGFKKTAIGWLLGGLGARFDVNGRFGAFVFALLASSCDSLLDFGLRRMLDQPEPFPGIAELSLRALITGLLVLVAFSLIQRVHSRRQGYRG